MPSRYTVQERFRPWGPEGQERLKSACAVVVGVGALGGASAGLLARAGVGRLRIIDPDRPSLDNLHRQLLYTEDDVADGLSKVQAAARFLSRANHEVAIEPLEVKLDQGNAAELLAGADVVIDGLDNPTARRHLNLACLDLGMDWVHGGVVGSSGQVLVIRPGRTPCLACWVPGGLESEPRRSVAAEGVIGPLPSCVASIQAAEAIKLLLGQDQAVLRGMLSVELWPPRFRVFAPTPGMGEGCPACHGRFDHQERP